MTNELNSVDIQGMGNTMDLNKLMSLYTSNFTEGFLQVLEKYNSPSQKVKFIENEVKQSTVRKPKSFPKNKGFEKLKNPLLKENLQRAKNVEYYSQNHIRVKELGYKSIYEIDKGSRKKWEQFFSNGTVYLDQNVTNSQISKSVLFDKSIETIFGSKKTPKRIDEFDFQLQTTPSKRKHVVGGKHGKIKGFDFYFQDRERLKPFQKRILLQKSEVFICEIMDKLRKQGESFDYIMKGPEFLDPNHHSIELMENWNDIFDKYGYLIDDFKSKWEREFIGNKMTFGKKKDNSNSINPLKVELLEKRKIKSNYSSIMD